MRHYEAQAEVRKHYYLDEYVAIAPKRTHSLHHVDYPKAGLLKSPPLEAESSVLEIPGDKDWAVKVIRNIYPAFSLGNKKAYGVQEIILEANPADVSFAELPAEQILRVFEAYRHRLDALHKIRDIKYVSIFHNDGLEAGASVKQTHSQLVGIGVVPPKLAEEARVFTELRRSNGTSPLDQAVRWELQEKTRLIYNDSYLVAITPYASQHPYEVWLIPKREVESIRDLKQTELEVLAKTLKAIALNLTSEQIPYNFHLIDEVKGYDNHFMIKITPRPNVWAGFELNTGIPINPVAPEDAAERYRNFCKTHNLLA